MIWGVWLGLIFLGRVPGGRPAAWDAGEAVPWPKPGEKPAEREEDDERDVEGEASELFADSDNGENPNAARRERAKRRKRKQRRS